MKRNRVLPCVVGIAALLLAAAPGAAATTIAVAPPTGIPETDWTHVQNAVDRAAPGDIVQFAAGTYIVGGAWPDGVVVVDTPGLTLRGHPAGTTLWGADPADLTPGLFEGPLLSAPGIKVERLSFRYFSWAGLNVADLLDPTWVLRGAVTIRNCTFSNSGMGVWGMVQSEDTTTLRGNTFVDVVIGFVVSGGSLRFTENTVMIADPAAIPFLQRPFNVGINEALLDDAGQVWLPCRDNLFDNNTVFGEVDGFILFDCQSPVVRDNRFVGSRIMEDPFSPGSGVSGDLGTIAWLVGTDGARIAGNVLDGSQGGTGLMLMRSTRTTVVDNTFRNMRISPYETGVDPYQGTGITLTPGSDFNRIMVNRFEDNAGPAVVCSGDYNLLMIGDPDDEVLDDGVGNELKLDY